MAREGDGLWVVDLDEHGKQRHYIARVEFIDWTAPDGGDDAYRHARLIAAAPDLLEACEVILAGLKRGSVPVGAMPRLEAAIAKATGGES